MLITLACRYQSLANSVGHVDCLALRPGWDLQLGWRPARVWPLLYRRRICSARPTGYGAFVVVPRPAAEVHAWYALAVLYSDLLMPTHVKEN